MLPSGYTLLEILVPPRLGYTTTAICFYHAAFDSNLIGFTPHPEVTVRLNVQGQIDRPSSLTP